MTPGTRGGWWRRNRAALLVLPIAAALAVGAGTSRLVEFGVPGDLTDLEPTGALGEPLTARIVEGDLARDFTVTAIGAEPVDVVEGVLGPEPAGAPAGSTVWEITLRFEAAPEATLDFCSYAVLDEQGREVRFALTMLPAPVQWPDCVPGFTEAGAVRPETYEVRLPVVLADGTRPRQLRLWWSGPESVLLDLTSQ